MVSCVIPSRNEPYLKQTIDSLLLNATGEIEIFAVLDGYWPEEFVTSPYVHYIHLTQPIGMRGAINAGVAVSNGEFILKTDAHCLFAKGYDTILTNDCRDNMIIVPRRYALDVKNWKIEERTDDKYPLDKMYLDENLQGRPVREKNKEPIEDLMTAQGSCWFMKRKYYEFLELLDEDTYGTFWQEFQEIGFKAWLSGGRIVSDTNTYYAHFHKTEGRGYSLPSGEQEQTRKMIEKWKNGKVWHKQIYNLDYLFDKFKDLKKE